MSRDYYEENASKLYKLFCEQIGTSLDNVQTNYEACRQDKLRQYDNLKDLGCSEIREKYKKKLIESIKNKTDEAIKVALVIERIKKTKIKWNNFLTSFSTFMKAFVVGVLLIMSNATFNTNNLKQNENFEVSEVEIEDFF